MIEPEDIEVRTSAVEHRGRVWRRATGVGWGGKYTEDSNTMVVQSDGFLDDPTTTDDAVRFVVAHEMGH